MLEQYLKFEMYALVKVASYIIITSLRLDLEEAGNA